MRKVELLARIELTSRSYEDRGLPLTYSSTSLNTYMTKKVKWLLTIAAVAGVLVVFVPGDPWHRVLAIIAQLATVFANSPLVAPLRSFF